MMTTVPPRIQLTNGELCALASAVKAPWLLAAEYELRTCCCSTATHQPFKELRFAGVAPNHPLRPLLSSLAARYGLTAVDNAVSAPAGVSILGDPSPPSLLYEDYFPGLLSLPEIMSVFGLQHGIRAPPGANGGAASASAQSAPGYYVASLIDYAAVRPNEDTAEDEAMRALSADLGLPTPGTHHLALIQPANACSMSMALISLAAFIDSGPAATFTTGNAPSDPHAVSDANNGSLTGARTSLPDFASRCRWVSSTGAAIAAPPDGGANGGIGHPPTFAASAVIIFASVHDASDFFERYEDFDGDGLTEEEGLFLPTSLMFRAAPVGSLCCPQALEDHVVRRHRTKNFPALLRYWRLDSAEGTAPPSLPWWCAQARTAPISTPPPPARLCVLIANPSPNASIEELVAHFDASAIQHAELFAETANLYAAPRRRLVMQFATADAARACLDLDGQRASCLSGKSLVKCGTALPHFDPVSNGRSLAVWRRPAILPTKATPKPGPPTKKIAEKATKSPALGPSSSGRSPQLGAQRSPVLNAAAATSAQRSPVPEVPVATVANRKADIPATTASLSSPIPPSTMEAAPAKPTMNAAAKEFYPRSVPQTHTPPVRHADPGLAAPSLVAPAAPPPSYATISPQVTSRPLPAGISPYVTPPLPPPPPTYVATISPSSLPPPPPPYTLSPMQKLDGGMMGATPPPMYGAGGFVGGVLPPPMVGSGLPPPAYSDYFRHPVAGQPMPPPPSYKSHAPPSQGVS